MNYKTWSRVLVAVAVLAFTVPAGLAQNSKTGPKYDTAGEVKIKGVIEEVREQPGEYEGTHLLVKTDTASVLVHVAPADFLKEIDTTFKKGDQVEVVGCKASGSAQEEILAREITVGSNTFTLRDDKGIPIWSGWKPAKASGK